MSDFFFLREVGRGGWLFGCCLVFRDSHLQDLHPAWLNLIFALFFFVWLQPRTAVESYKNILPRNLTWNLKMLVSNRNLLFLRSIFRFHVEFQGRISYPICIFDNTIQPTSVSHFSHGFSEVDASACCLVVCLCTGVTGRLKFVTEAMANNKIWQGRSWLKAILEIYVIFRWFILNFM